MSNRASIAVAIACALPGPVLRLSGIGLGTVSDTALFGLSIVAAAFLLSWAAEASERDIAQGLAVAGIALIAVLPEFAVDVTFAWKAGTDPEFATYAAANFTGGNRLLIGGAWPLIFFLYWWKTRSRLLRLERGHAVEVVALFIATLYAFTLPLKDSITLVDTILLGLLFAAYMSIVSRAPSEEPELMGPALSIGALPTSQRRAVIAALFLAAAGAIFASAEPFAEGLVRTGERLGIDEFLLVQWLAPLASEAPEFLVAAILALRGRAAVAMGALLAAKVNQWTLLVGGLPVAYAVSSGTLDGLPIDPRQQGELFLTAAQSLFAVALLATLSLSARQAVLVSALFLLQLLVPLEEVRLAVAAVYVVLGLTLLARRRVQVARLWGIAYRGLRHPSTLAE